MKRDKKGRFIKGMTPWNYKQNYNKKGLKCCVACRIYLITSKFVKDKSRVDGFYVYCKNCSKKQRKAKSKLHSKYARAYYLKNKLTILPRNKKYYQKNKVKLNRQSKKYYLANKLKIMAWQQRWVENNQEKSNAIKAAWKKRNPGLSHYYTVLRRMRIKNQIPENADLEAIRNFYKNCPKGMEVDHKMPISKGGPHVVYNLQYLSPAENRKKGNNLL